MSASDWAEEVRALVERTCEEQGVPVTISDPTTVAQVVALLRGAGAGDGRKRGSASTSPAPARSEAPHRADAIDRDGAGSSHAGHDLDVID